jgi:hypothetical protein
MRTIPYTFEYPTLAHGTAARQSPHRSLAPGWRSYREAGLPARLRWSAQVTPPQELLPAANPARPFLPPLRGRVGVGVTGVRIRRGAQPRARRRTPSPCPLPQGEGESRTPFPRPGRVSGEKSPQSYPFKINRGEGAPPRRCRFICTPRQPNQSLWEPRPRGDGAQVKTRELSSNRSPSTLRKKSCQSCLFNRNRGGLRPTSIPSARAWPPTPAQPFA